MVITVRGDEICNCWGIDMYELGSNKWFRQPEEFINAFTS